MIDAFALRQRQTVTAYERRAQWSWWIMFVGLLGITGLICLTLRKDPSWAMIAWLIYFGGIITIFYRPRYGLYMIVGFTLVADQFMYGWYPFAKNFSGRDSMMFVNRALIFSPLETYLVFTIVAWLGRMAMERRIRIFTGWLFWPAMLFMSFITLGLAYGLSRHGNVNIGLWEVRPIYYLAVMLVLTSNLIRTRAHVNQLIWVIIIALFTKGLAGNVYVATVLHWDAGSVEQIAEHAMSIHFNVFFILMIAVWLYHDSTLKRILIPLMAPSILFSFFANHRRAGFLTLGIAVAVIFLLLYRENRKLFWAIAPTGTVLFFAYLAAFWNNTGSIGIVARAVRSVVGQPTARDAASNIYREIENINSMFNIKSSPLFGLGFGQKFYIVAPMPDISKSFAWWEYITHNSIMWMWMQCGAGGFFSMLLLVGSAMILGGRAVWDMPRGPLRGAALTASLYLLAHFIYAYVDMSWDTDSMVLVGTMMGLINCLYLVAAQPVPIPARRWPWQILPTLTEDNNLLMPPVLPSRKPQLAPGMVRVWRPIR
jgi:hypothetical protein